MSQPHNTAYKAERSERELGLTMVLSVFPHYLINSTIWKKKVVENKMCFAFLNNFF
jgi:hypothetical protein